MDTPIVFWLILISVMLNFFLGIMFFSFLAEKNCITGATQAVYQNRYPTQINIDTVEFCWETF